MNKRAFILTALFASAAPAMAMATESCDTTLRPQSLVEMLTPKPGQAVGAIILLQENSPLLEMIRLVPPHKYGEILNREVGGPLIFDERTGEAMTDLTYSAMPMIKVNVCVPAGTSMPKGGIGGIMLQMNGGKGIVAISPDSLLSPMGQPAAPQP
jgi:hypothetical protein